MTRRTKKFILLLALIVIFGAVSVTLAYDAVETRTRNAITTGKVEIAIDETSSSPSAVKTKSGELNFSGIMPGQTVSKEVSIRNEAADCWLRVKVVKDVVMAEGVEKPADFERMIGIDYDATNWEESDGYYYYKTMLGSGTSTATPLFTHVTFAPQMGNEYVGSTVSVTVTAEAIQYKNNEDGLLAWGGGGE